MSNGKNPLVWAAIIIMIVVIAFVLVIAEGVRRKSQEDRPGGPVGQVESSDSEQRERPTEQ